MIELANMPLDEFKVFVAVVVGGGIGLFFIYAGIVWLRDRLTREEE